MQTEIIISGFGGQGILFAGDILACGAMLSGQHTTWYPSYGPEMRGGTAHCSVVISDEEIGSPIVEHPDVLLVMNRPSLDKYEPMVKNGGVLIIDSSMVDRSASRTDLTVVQLPATAAAEALGEKRVANIILVGALLAKLPILTPEMLKTALAERLPEKRKALLPLNVAALERGYAFGQLAA